MKRSARDMHRAAAWRAAACLVLLLPAGLPAAPVAPQSPRPLALTISVGRTVAVGLISGKAVFVVVNTREGVLDVKAAPGDPTRVLLNGRAVGAARVQLTDADGQSEAYDVQVQAATAAAALPTASPTPPPGPETRSPDDFELFLEGVLEAPRGPSQTAPGDPLALPRYAPACRTAPGCCGNGACPARPPSR